MSAGTATRAVASSGFLMVSLDVTIVNVAPPTRLTLLTATELAAGNDDQRRCERRDRTIQQFERGDIMEFLVKFEITIPDKAPSSEVAEREAAEATAVARLAELGHVARIWRLTAPGGRADALGLYRAESRAQLDTLLEALPLHEWMRTTVTPLEPHPNDPTGTPVGAAGDRSEP